MIQDLYGIVGICFIFIAVVNSYEAWIYKKNRTLGELALNIVLNISGQYLMWSYVFNELM